MTHVTPDGKINMVDVQSKSTTHRSATARAVVRVGTKIIGMIKNNEMTKGNVLTCAEIAGIMAAKNTANLIPLCHNLNLTGVKINTKLGVDSVFLTAVVTCKGKTGVEMEALMAVSIASLTVYDMCKAVSHDIVISDVELIEKRGGKSDITRSDVTTDSREPVTKIKEHDTSPLDGNYPSVTF